MKIRLFPQLLTFLVAGLVSALTSCDQKPPAEAVDNAAGEEVAALEKVRTRLERELKEARAATDKGQSEILQKNDLLQKQNDELKAQFEKSQDEAAKVQREFDDYKAKYKASARAKMKGLAIPKIEGADNTAYESVVIKEVTPMEVSFTHSGGVARVPLASLPKVLQEKCLYDPREQEEVVATQKAVEEATHAASTLPDVSVKTPNHGINPVVVNNLKNRIVARKQQIAEAEAEMSKVRNSGYGGTSMGSYRLKVLSMRIARLNDDIRSLTAMLNGEING